MQFDQAGSIARRRLAFITANGLPWENDPLYHREQKMLAAQKTEEALQLEIAAKKEAEAVSGTPDAPEGTEEQLQLVRDFDIGEGR
jgi:hypothetical protein